jgi:hypothetical protein
VRIKSFERSQLRRFNRIVRSSRSERNDDSKSSNVSSCVQTGLTPQVDGHLLETNSSARNVDITILADASEVVHLSPAGQAVYSVSTENPEVISQVPRKLYAVDLDKFIPARGYCEYSYKYNKKIRRKYDFAAAIVIVIKTD